jgi:UDPglucose--hexose-1-phosphate uridylyltransferase
MTASSSGLWPIQFRSQSMESRILERDDTGNYVERPRTTELRFDPLTGRTCRLIEFSIKGIRRPDVTGIVRRSLDLGCPFCPPTIEKVVPRFPARLVPGGTLRKGEAFVFPNARPYDVYSAVVVMSREHFISLTDFTLDILLNAFTAAQAYLGAVQKADSEAKYNLVAWNYFPPSGGSVVHPHIQCNIGYSPTVYQKETLEASKDYFGRIGTNYWNDLVEQEMKIGQRYVGTTGNTRWLTSFAPRGRLTDILAVFPGKTTVHELSEEDLHDFAEGLLKVFRYMDETNLLSFNLSTYSGFDRNQFWFHVRIIPRSLLLYSPIETSDEFYYQVLHDEGICLLSAEAACDSLKKYFAD